MGSIAQIHGYKSINSMRCIDDLDITSAQGKLMLNVLSAISEFERDLLGERIKSGVAHARCKGTKSGKAIGPSFNQIERVKLLLHDFINTRNCSCIRHKQDNRDENKE